MSRQEHTESNTIRQSVETTEVTSDQSAEALPDLSISNVASTEATTHEKTGFDTSCTSLPADIDSLYPKVATFESEYGAANLSQDEFGDSTSTAPSGDHIYTWPVPSPGIAEVQLHEFLDLPETQDISANPTDPTKCGSYYVPMQARPLLSYTEHQRAIYFPRPRFPTGFDPHKLIHLNDSAHTDVNCVSGEYLDAEDLYDMPLKAAHNNRP